MAASELESLERVHQAAQARLGIAAAFLALLEWENVQALDAVATASEWLIRAMRTITAARKLSRHLAVAYYQLARALETGSTLGVPEGSTSKDVTLGILRSNFRDIALDVSSLPATRTLSEDPDIRWFEKALRDSNIQAVEAEGRAIRLSDARVDPLIQLMLDVQEDNDLKPIRVTRYDWGDDIDLATVQEAFEALLRQEGPNRLADKVEAVRSSETLTPRQALGEIEQASSTIGSEAAGLVDAISVSAGRDAITAAVREDRLVKLIARGTSGDPCAFCAMLASRGFVYASNQTAGVGEEVEKFHPNCHCYPIVRWSRTSQLPALNTYFREKWNEVTKGYSNNDARKAFRRWIYAQRKANPDDPHGFKTP